MTSIASSTVPNEALSRFPVIMFLQDAFCLPLSLVSCIQEQMLLLLQRHHGGMALVDEEQGHKDHPLAHWVFKSVVFPMTLGMVFTSLNAWSLDGSMLATQMVLSLASTRLNAWRLNCCATFSHGFLCHWFLETNSLPYGSWVALDCLHCFWMVPAGLRHAIALSRGCLQTSDLLYKALLNCSLFSIAIAASSHP